MMRLDAEQTAGALASACNLGALVTEGFQDFQYGIVTRNGLFAAELGKHRAPFLRDALENGTDEEADGGFALLVFGGDAALEPANDALGLLQFEGFADPMPAAEGLAVGAQLDDGGRHVGLIALVGALPGDEFGLRAGPVAVEDGGGELGAPDIDRDDS